MELFGADLSQPDIPRVYLRSLEDGLVWNWGKALRHFDWRSGKYSTIAKESDTILAFTKDSQNRWVVSNDSKELSLYDSVSFKLIDSKLLKRRVTSLDSFESHVVLGDKFGDLFVSADADLMEPSAFLGKSEEVEEEAGAVSESATVDCQDSEKGRRWDARETLKTQDEVLRNMSINGLLASITMMKVDRIPDNSSRTEGSRNVLITADRDEKIRVSRLPDIYRIDSILCGHTEFVTDFQLIDGTSLLVSCAADKSLRLWDISQDVQLAEAQLEAVPFNLQAASHDITNNQFDVYICLCGSRQVLTYRVDIKEHTLTQRAAVDFSDLTQSPLIALAVRDGEIICLDTSGKLISREKSVLDGEVHVEVDNEVPSFVRFWKHDRDESANKRIKLS